MQIALIRHFATKGNLEKRYIGRSDEEILPVKETGDYPEAELVFASPLKRCRETAERLYPKTGQIIVEDFRECDFGRFEGKNYKELSEDPEYQRWIDSGGKLPFPEGESMERFIERSISAFEKEVEMLQEKKVKKAAMVVHGGTIMAVLSTYGIPKKGYFDRQCKNGCGYLITISEEEWKKGKKECKVEKEI